MSYKQIKWFIILVPMISVEIWEIVRHNYLHKYISMTIGNWLSAVIVLAVTLLLAMRLFAKMEQLQEELNRERADKAVLLEREKIARELHDGIAQSLFLLSVKMHKLETENSSVDKREQLKRIKETIRRVHDDVRQSITNLRLPPSTASSAWSQSLKAIVESFQNETGLPVTVEWNADLDQEQNGLTPKEKVEICACLREALMNIRKHANANHVRVHFAKDGSDWHLGIEDDGIGFTGDPFQYSSRYGLRMMKERTAEMGWLFTFSRSNGRTRVDIWKGGQA